MPIPTCRCRSRVSAAVLAGLAAPSAQSSTLLLDPEAEDLTLATAENAYAEGMVLAAIELTDCNGDGEVGLLPFRVTQPPKMTSAGGSPTLNINHNPGSLGSNLNKPGGFNGQVNEDCAIVGRFRIISYRVSPPPPTGAPTLERRDLTISGDWIPVARNIENLQVRYGAGEDDNMMDAPAAAPSDDPLTWINRVAVTITGRTESARLRGSTAGVFDPEDIYIRACRAKSACGTSSTKPRIERFSSAGTKCSARAVMSVRRRHRPNALSYVCSCARPF